MPYTPGFYRAIKDGVPLNIRSRDNTSSLVLGQLRTGDIVYVMTGLTTQNDGYTWLRIHTRGFDAFIALVSSLTLTEHNRYHDLLFAIRGSEKVYRLSNNRGSSEILWTKRYEGHTTWIGVKNSQGEWYHADWDHIYRDGDNTRVEGDAYLVDGPILPRFMRVDDTFDATPELRYVDKQTGVEYNRGGFPHTIKFVAAHENYTFDSGITLPFVYELHAFTPGASEPFDINFYSPGYGLVGFESKTNGFKSWISEVLPASAKREFTMLDWIEDSIVLAPDQRVFPPDDHEEPQPEPEPEEPDMPQLDIEVMESHQDYIQRWANPRFVHDANWHQTRLPQGDPNGVIISYPSDWGFFIADNSSQATVAQTLNAGATELKMDVAQKLIYQGPEKVASQLQLTWPGTYLFLWRVGTLISVGAQNLQYGLRIHMADDTVYGFSDHPGETRLFPTFNGQDHSGVWGLLVNIPEPQNVESVGLLARTNAEGVQGEMFWRYVNAFKAPPGVMPADLGINVGIIDIPAIGEPTPEPTPPDEEPEPTPEPTPTPSGNALANLLRDIGVALIDYADDVD